MDKLSNPFKSGVIRISQTTHNHLGGHTDFTMVRAIDCNREPFDDKVYAEGDGLVVASVNASNPSSYLHISYDGMVGHILRELVHVRPAVVKGTRVKRGQLVGTLEPYRANFYGTGLHHAVHLHWSFLNTNKTGAPNPFNYLDRTTPVTTNAAVIKNHRTWFNADGSFNWSSFGDYKLELATPAPVVPVPTCEAERKQIEALKGQLQSAQLSISTLTAYKNQVDMEKGNLEKLVKQQAIEIANLKTLEQILQDIGGMHEDEMEALRKEMREQLATKDEKILELQEKIDNVLEKITFMDFIRKIGIALRGGSK